MSAVIVTDEWPKRLLTTARGTPWASLSDAAPWRRSCSRTARSPVALTNLPEQLGHVAREQVGTVLTGEHAPGVGVGVAPLYAVDALPELVRHLRFDGPLSDLHPALAAASLRFPLGDLAVDLHELPAHGDHPGV